MGAVVAVSLSGENTFQKAPQEAIRLIAGIGVEGDAHAGATVQHLYLKRRNPNSPNLRQVHLMHAELFDRLGERGFRVGPGQLGENITTSGVDLLDLGEGTLLFIGEATLRVTGLRSPCSQIDKFQPGLLAEMIEDKRAKRFLSGIMSVVEIGGLVRPGDAVVITPAAGAFRRLQPV